MDRVLEIWQSGGWVMVPLFALAVLLYAQAFQLVFYVRRTRLGGDSELHWWDWVREPEKAQGRVGEIIRYTQDDASSEAQVRNRFDEVRSAIVHLIDRRSRFVSTLVGAAPLMGLLGTVLGMLQTFFGISTSGGAETAGVVETNLCAVFGLEKDVVVGSWPIMVVLHDDHPPGHAEVAEQHALSSIVYRGGERVLAADGREEVGDV